MERASISKKLFQGDKSIWIIFLLLCSVSIIEAFSATSTLALSQANIWIPIVRHTTFLIIGFLLVLGIAHVPHRFFQLGMLLMPLTIILLAITLIAGFMENETTRRISALGTPFQPSEFGKLACVIFIAFFLSKREKFSNNKTSKIISYVVAIVCGLILRANLSTVLLIVPVTFFMMYIGQISFTIILKRLFEWIAVAFLIFFLLFVSPPELRQKIMPRAATWIARLERYINTDERQTNNTYIVNDNNYQIAHAKMAIARGGVLGKLPGKSLLRDFLPQAYSDFIYVIIIEEFGIFIGGIGVLLLYIMLMIRVAIIARRCEKSFPQFLVLGCGLLIVFQALVHMAVSVGFFPVTGQPLPLISIGGTSIIVTSICIGMILSVSHFGANMSDKDEEEEEENEAENEAYPAENHNLVPEFTAIES